MRVYLTDEALDSPNAITAYVEERNASAARRLRERLKVRMRNLADNPRSGRKVPEYDVESVREILEGSYRIWYRVAENRIEVLAIFHAARNV